MIGLLKRSRGVTMMEIIVALLIFTVVVTIGSLVLSANLRLYMKANELAESGPLLDSVANEIISDMSGTTGEITINGNSITIPITDNGDKTTYSIDGGGILLRDGVAAFPEHFYKKKTVDIACAPQTDGGGRVNAYILTVIITSGNGSELARRDYAVRPLVLNQASAVGP